MKNQKGNQLPSKLLHFNVFCPTWRGRLSGHKTQSFDRIVRSSLFRCGGLPCTELGDGSDRVVLMDKVKVIKPVAPLSY